MKDFDAAQTTDATRSVDMRAQRRRKCPGKRQGRTYPRLMARTQPPLPMKLSGLSGPFVARSMQQPGFAVPDAKFGSSAAHTHLLRSAHIEQALLNHQPLRGRTCTARQERQQGERLTMARVRTAGANSDWQSRMDRRQPMQSSRTQVLKHLTTSHRSAVRARR